MDLADLTAPPLIDTALAGGDRHSVLRSLAELLASPGGLGDIDKMHQRLEQREALGSTGIGNGIAVPHCKTARIEQVILAIGVAARPIPFGAIDGVPVRLFFAVVSPESQPAAHLRCLAEISRWVKDSSRVTALLESATPQALFSALPGAELRIETATQPADGES